MAGPLIYIPAITGADPQHLVRVGLGSLLDPGVSLEGADVLAHGPDGGRGMVFRWCDSDHPERSPALGVFKHQEWAPCKPTDGMEAGRFWMGKEVHNPPKPDDLLRGTNYGGLPVKLAGHLWMVPVARQLKHSWGLDEFGIPCRRINRRYQAFYDKAMANFETFKGFKDGNSITIVGGWPFAIEALSLNYRVDHNLVDWLELFDSDEDLMWTVGATFEFSHYLAIESQKKTEQ